MADDATRPQGTMGKRRSWPAKITFLAIGLMIGGGTDITGTGGGVLIVGFFLFLVGLGGLAFNGEQ
ncbi:MAG TPA: hypothetical protein VGC05_10535 [Mycobacterium sp.]